MAATFLLAAALRAQSTTVPRTARLIDGAGNVLENQNVVVEGSRIRAIRASSTGSDAATI